MVGVLGGLGVWRDGTPVAVSSGVASVLLSMLAVERHPVTSNELLDVLQRVGVKIRSQATVHTAVWRLRRVLGDDALAAAVGYSLNRDICTTDAAIFEDTLADARAKRAAGDPCGAAALFGEAIALWRGPALAELSAGSHRYPHALRLEELRIGASEEWAAALAADSRPGEAVRVLERIVHAHPLREHAWALLIVAQDQAGRRADARFSFDQARLRLAEHGLEPGLELLARSARLAVPPLASDVDGDDPGTPLPPIVKVLRRHPVVGHHETLDILRTALGLDTADLGTSIVLVSGPAGIGKTRLVAEAVAEAHRAGARIWFEVTDSGSCAPLSPLGSWARAVASGLPQSREQEVCRGPLRSLLHPSEAWPASTDPDHERWALYEAVAALVAEVCGRRSVLVLDDLHRAPSDTLALLGYLLSTRPSLPLCVVCSYRPGAVDDQWLAALQALKRHPGLTGDVVVPALDRQASTQLFATLSPSADDVEADDDELADRLVRVTGGNPALIHRVAFDGDALAHAVKGGPLPGTLAQEVAGRLTEQLDADSRWAVELAAAAAVAQPVVPGRVLVAAAALIGRPSACPVLDGARKATNAGILHEAPGVEHAWHFDNELFCHSIYECIPAQHRERMHGAIGDVLRSLPDPVSDDRRAERIAFHLYRAWPGCQAAEAALWLRAAAEQAIDRADHKGAAALVAQALELYAGEATSTADRERGELWLFLGRARVGAGDGPGAAMAFNEAGRLGRQYGWPDIEAAAVVSASR